MTGHDRDLPPELSELGERLRHGRPQLTSLELDRVKTNTMRMKGNYMRARLTILAALVVGVLMMGTGGALAGSALSTGSTAAQGEYHGDGHGTGGVHGSGGNGSVLGQGSRCTENGSGANGSGNTGSSGSSSSNEACSRQFAENDVQASGQAESSGSGTLPFTGFLAIPVLLLGVGLVGSGVVLRRRLDSERS